MQTKYVVLYFHIRTWLILSDKVFSHTCIRIGKRGGHKVKGFKGEWLSSRVVGLKVNKMTNRRMWLVVDWYQFQFSSFVAPYKADVTKAVMFGAHCSRGRLCCIKEGFSATMKHADCKKHKVLRKLLKWHWNRNLKNGGVLWRKHLGWIWINCLGFEMENFE